MAGLPSDDIPRTAHHFNWKCGDFVKQFREELLEVIRTSGAAELMLSAQKGHEELCKGINEMYALLYRCLNGPHCVAHCQRAQSAACQSQSTRSLAARPHQAHCAQTSTAPQTKRDLARIEQPSYLIGQPPIQARANKVLGVSYALPSTSQQYQVQRQTQRLLRILQATLSLESIRTRARKTSECTLR